MRAHDLAAGLLRRLDPEDAHGLTVRMLALGLGPRAPAADPILATALCGLPLANCIGLAAGFDKNAQVPNAMLAAGFGFVECGTVTPEPQAGNPRPRLFRLTEDLAVAIGGLAETQEMLNFCGEHNITSEVEVIPIQKVNEAYERLLEADVKYRFSIDMASLKSE